MGEVELVKKLEDKDDEALVIDMKSPMKNWNSVNSKLVIVNS